MEDKNRKGMLLMAVNTYRLRRGKKKERNGGQEQGPRGEKAGVGQGSGREAQAAREGQQKHDPKGGIHVLAASGEEPRHGAGGGW